MNTQTIFTLATLLSLTACASEDAYWPEGEGYTADEKSPPPRRSRLIVRPVSGFGEDFIIANSTEDVAVFRLMSTGEPMELTDFTLEAYESAGGGATCGYYAYDGFGNFHDWDLYITGTLSFNGTSIYVPRRSRGSSLLIVQACLSPVGIGYATTEQDIQVSWTDSSVSATGLFSGNVYDARAVTDEADGPLLTTHMTEPYFAHISLTTSPLVSGVATDVHKFTVENSPADDLIMDGFLFDLTTTDSGGAGWNTCANFGDNTLYDLYKNGSNVTSYLLSVGSWSFYNEDGVECSKAPTDTVASMEISGYGDIISAGEMVTYAIRLTVPSATSGDQLQYDISDVSWGYYASSFKSPDLFDSTLIDGLPMTGDLWTFY